MVGVLTRGTLKKRAMLTIGEKYCAVYKRSWEILVQLARKGSYRVLLRSLANIKFPSHGTVSSTRCKRLQESDQITIPGRSFVMAM